MSCIETHQFVEILDRGGLDVATPEEQAHLGNCETCRESWATVAAAGEVLADVKRPRAGRFARLFPLLAAAAILLGIIGIVTLRTIPPDELPDASKPKPAPTAEELVLLLIDGKADDSRRARELLENGGRDLLPALVASRRKHKSSPNYRVLQDLIFSLKRAAHQDDPAAAAVFKKLDAMEIEVRFTNTLLSDALAFIMDFSGLSVVLDPALPPSARDRVIDVNVKGTPLREVLDLVCTIMELDFDLRYGILFLSSPERLWLPKGGDASAVLPLRNAWTVQELAAGDREVADTLRRLRITIDMQNAPLSAIADYLKEISRLKVDLAPELPAVAVSLRVADVPMEHVVELLTLPFGLDARIEAGAVRLFSARR